MNAAWTAPLVAIALTQVAVIATSIYLHRALAHRSLHVHPFADVAFRTALWLTTGQCRQEWVAVHRKHHTFTDREGDPHSPRLFGFWHVQLLNVVYYVREARNPQTLETFAPDLRPDRLDRVLFSHGVMGVGVGLTLLCALIGLGPGLAAGLLHAGLYVFVMAPLINALGHWRGTKNFENGAYNSRLLAWITGGESLHNNHHAYPKSAKFSMRPSEFDPSWTIIRSLAAAGLLVIPGPPIAWAHVATRVPAMNDVRPEGTPSSGVATAGAEQLTKAKI
jgi:stearoyl-CoA desaturase (delta-9 desaturase)